MERCPCATVLAIITFTLSSYFEDLKVTRTLHLFDDFPGECARSERGRKIKIYMHDDKYCKARKHRASNDPLEKPYLEKC